MGDINLAAVAVADGIGVLLAAMILSVRSWNKSSNKEEAKVLLWFLIVAVTTCIADFFGFLLDGVPGTFCRIIYYFSNFWLYLSNLIIGTMFFRLLVVHIHYNKIPKFQQIFIFILDIIGLIILIINFFTPIVFKVDENNVYTRGPLFVFYTVVQAIFIVDSLVFYFTTRKTNKQIKYFPVWQFIVPVIIGIAVQFIFYGISTINVSIVIGICGIVMGMYNESEIENEALRQHEIDTRTIIEQKEKLEIQSVELEKALKAAESSSNAKTAFLNNMSHDIRTPMNAILGYADIAYRHKAEEETVGDSLLKIKTSGKHLLNLINDVLEMSRIESGKLRLINSPIDIRELIDGVEKMSLVLAIPKSIDFQTNIGEIKDAYVLADELHLNEVLINLVSNAVKYTPEGGKVYFNVSQISAPENNAVKFRFEVKDNGIGMTDEFQKHLFESFSRDENNAVHNIEGTGLGLAIVKKIVDLSKGKISVQSKLNEGSTFIVELPIKLMSVEQKEAFIGEQRKKELNLQEVNLKGKKVLLVEDNEMNREIAKDLLTEAGLEFDCAEDGAIAVKKVKENGANAFDVILMDIQMPIMNGYEATRAIREMYPDDDLIIIALSANAFAEDKEASLEAGMNDHIAKPIEKNLLFKTVSRYLK